MEMKQAKYGQITPFCAEKIEFINETYCFGESPDTEITRICDDIEFCISFRLISIVIQFQHGLVHITDR
jgi:hypothetical protein